MNLKKLYVAGVMTGSMARWVRSRRGVEWLIVGVTRLWRIVGMMSVDGQRYEGRCRRLWMSDRLGRETGVRMSLQLLLEPGICKGEGARLTLFGRDLMVQG
jgi:hypothetical protein